jgi:hypothetical protein
MPHPLLATIARVWASSRALAVQRPMLWLSLFMLGGTLGIVVISHAGSWTRDEVLPPVLALGLSVPIGWFGAGLRRR